MSTLQTTTSSSRPSAQAGDTYFETDTKNIIVYDGSNWRGYVSDGIPFGKGSTSADFDGVDDYISVADADNLSFGDGSNDSPFSLAAWVKQDAAGCRILCKTFENDLEYAFTVGGNNIVGLSLYDGDYNNRIQANHQNALNPGLNKWYHVAATYDGSGSVSGITNYLDGNLVSSTAVSFGSYTAMHNTSTPLDIGRLNLTISGTNYESFTNGQFDDVAVIAKELTADEVTAIYNSNSYPLELVSLWRFEGNANDSFGSNNGTNNGTNNGPTDLNAAARS